MKLGVSITLLVGLFLTLAMLFRAGWERPPMDSTQLGFRGLGMVEIDNPRTQAARAPLNQLPDVVPAVPAGGPAAASVYKNVQVLNDLSVGEFTRLMVAMTSWVSPQEGCNYCHNPSDLAADVPAKVVARRMLQMTRHVNADWKSHVAETGVTCFTCHRGQPVPSNVWYADPGPAHGSRFAGNRAGQNAPATSVGLTSLPGDPFSQFLTKGGEEIRVQSAAALPAARGTSIQQTEATYGLMMHISQSLGANCTFCHNTRSFFDWDASTPQRATAWHGIRMVRDLNANYLEPLAGKYPEGRMGPLGDAPKLNCATCHQGEHKPLLGASMLKDYPALAAAGSPVAAAAPTPEPIVVGETVVIFFPVASAALHDQAPRVLEVLVVKLKANPRARATISGYHSATGDAAQNHELAKNRAMAVQGALKSAGIAEDRVVLEKPVVEQANVAGEDPKARRVEVVVK